MAVIYRCDNCGSEDGVGRFTVNIAVSTPHSSGHFPKCDCELCPACLQKTVAAIDNAFPKNRSR